MYKDGMTVIFDASEDINYRDIHMSNKGGYEVKFTLGAHDDVFIVTISRDMRSYTIQYAEWLKLGLSLDDYDVMEQICNLWYQRNVTNSVTLSERYCSSSNIVIYGDIRLKNPHHYSVSFSGDADNVTISVRYADDKDRYSIVLLYSHWLAAGYALSSATLADDIKGMVR